MNFNIKTILDPKRLVEFPDVFSETPKDRLSYLNGISRSTLLLATTTLLGFSNRNSKFEEFEKFLEMFFCDENLEFSKSVFSKLSSLHTQLELQRKQNGPPDELQIKLQLISPLSMLQLFEFCFDQLTDLDIQSKTETEINIFKAILITNGINNRKDDMAIESTTDLAENIRFPLFMLSQSFPYSELVNSPAREISCIQMIKSFFLFEFLQATPVIEPLFKEFLNHFECNNSDEFLAKHLPLIHAVLCSDRETHIDFKVKPDESFQTNCEFFEKLTIVDSEELVDYDFRKIRSKPFYRVETGHYRIIYGLFVLELIHKGLYFKLREMYKDLEDQMGSITNDKKAKDKFRAFYCDEFSEKFLLYKTIRSIYAGISTKEISGSEIKAEAQIDAEPDYYVRQDNKLFLFESKDILIKAEVKTSCDFNQIEVEFKKKLYFDNGQSKIEPKAVLQLVKNIERGLRKQFSFDNTYDASKLTIYPILVLHDHQLNIAGLSQLVNQWFFVELEKLSSKGLDVTKVKPLSILDIGTFIYHQDLLANQSIFLEDFISEYFKQPPIEPLSNFISRKLDDDGMIMPPNILRELLDKLRIN